LVVRGWLTLELGRRLSLEVGRRLALELRGRLSLELRRRLSLELGRRSAELHGRSTNCSHLLCHELQSSVVEVHVSFGQILEALLERCIFELVQLICDGISLLLGFIDLTSSCLLVLLEFFDLLLCSGEFLLSGEDLLQDLDVRAIRCSEFFVSHCVLHIEVLNFAKEIFRLSG